jgi:signal peptidase II
MNIWPSLGCFLFIIDRLTKSAALYCCAAVDCQLTSFLSCTYLLNQGISLSLLVPSNVYCYWLLTAAICAGTFFFSMCWFNVKTKLSYLSVGFFLITIGSFSNIIDRFLYRGVIDWIYFHYTDYHFPVFNMADAYIVLGTVLVFYTYIIKE